MPTWPENYYTISSSDGSDSQTSIVRDSITTDLSSSLTSENIEEYSIDAEEIIESLEGRRQPTLTSNRLVKKHMEQNSLEAWFLDRAMEQDSIEGLAARFPAYGNRAAESAVLERAKDRLDSETDRVVSDDDYIVAFNEVTDDWPHLPRPVLAGYLVRSDTDYPEDFEEQAQEFAEAEAVFDREMQVSLDAFYGTNPFNDDSLTDDEARTISVARMLDIDDADIPLDEIENHDNFVWWLKESSDIEKALRLHEFGRDLPEEVLEHAAPPDEWEIPTDSLRRRSCVECGEEHTRIHHHDAGVAFARKSGDVAEIADIEESDEFFYDAHESDSGTFLLCDRCFPDFDENRENKATVFVNGKVLRTASVGRVLRDFAVDNDELDSVGELTDEEMDAVMEITNFNINTSDWLALTASDGPATTTESEERIKQAIREPTELGPPEGTDGPVGVVMRSSYDGWQHLVLAKLDDWPGCRHVKELLDGTREVVA